MRGSADPQLSAGHSGLIDSDEEASDEEMPDLSDEGYGAAGDEAQAVAAQGGAPGHVDNDYYDAEEGGNAGVAGGQGPPLLGGDASDSSSEFFSGEEGGLELDDSMSEGSSYFIHHKFSALLVPRCGCI